MISPEGSGVRSGRRTNFFKRHLKTYTDKRKGGPKPALSSLLLQPQTIN